MEHSLKTIVAGIPSLGSYSGVLEELETVLNDPSSTLATMGETIEKDPDLTARLLKLGNSSFYGFSSRLETVTEAISLIGIQQVQDLIIASNVVEIFEGVSPEHVSMESFWRHSLACGVAARLLAIERRVLKPEKYFVAGLLHDVGRLVIYMRAPDAARKIFDCYGLKRMMLREAETQVLGFDHGMIAENLLRAWSYPPNLINAVGNHHHPMAAGVFQLEASLVHVADYLVHAMQIGGSGETFVPALDMRAWQRLELTSDFLESLIGAVDEQLEAAESVFLKPDASAPGNESET